MRFDLILMGLEFLLLSGDLRFLVGDTDDEEYADGNDRKKNSENGQNAVSCPAVCFFSMSLGKLFVGDILDHRHKSNN